MARGSFDYAHTCPKIDKEIDRAKDTITDYLKDYIQELCPYIENDKAISLSNEWGKTIYDAISSSFETVREANEDMRSEANRQIDRLTEEIADLNGQINELEKMADAR